MTFSPFGSVVSRTAGCAAAHNDASGATSNAATTPRRAAAMNDDMAGN
jgi:hypothetical protein